MKLVQIYFDRLMQDHLASASSSQYMCPSSSNNGGNIDEWQSNASVVSDTFNTGTAAGATADNTLRTTMSSASAAAAYQQMASHKTQQVRQMPALKATKKAVSRNF